MGLKERLRRLEREAERAEAPTWNEYWPAARRETARRLRGVYDRLARLGGDSSAPHPARDNQDTLLAGDTPERAEADRRVVERWERAHGKADIKGAAEHVRARLDDTRG